ncbi:hypothetical protein [Sediminitomix flava]|uniref:Uncharacterized protein n=1 Tax=Sediminitomix flava TaxID=379075 RepID=A0A315Z8K7_SEDFL|nr:hypothetical protein [Sediminitomix flava]PWJ41086.1 hypothetical protein BC781_104361 [Sediminitomix flava]
MTTQKETFRFDRKGECINPLILYRSSPTKRGRIILKVGEFVTKNKEVRFCIGYTVFDVCEIKPLKEGITTSNIFEGLASVSEEIVKVIREGGDFDKKAIRGFWRYVKPFRQYSLFPSLCPSNLEELQYRQGRK